MRIIFLLFLALPVFAHQYTSLDDLVADVCTQHSFEKCSDPVVDSDDDGVNDDADQCPDTPLAAPVDSVGCEVVAPAGLVQCADEPDYISRKGLHWFLCNLDSSEDLYYSASGIDYPMSYMTPKPDDFVTGSARVRLLMHNSNPSGGHVTGASSFSYDNSLLEVHVQEENYKLNGVTYPGGWWVYNGNQHGSVENYNGRKMQASLDWLVAKYGDKINLDKGIELVGVSLGGAGAFHQAMILPGYQDKIAIVGSKFGLMMIPKNHEAQVKSGWGTKAENQELYDAVDVRLQWEKVQDIHFSWRGGQNDNYDRFDAEFIDLCELRKISCSLAWLQSGHSTSESGYALNMNLFTHSDMDVTLDKVLPVITNNTSNYHGALRGYHNRGVVWNHSAIVDSETEIKIPLQYVAEKNIGPDLPDQPDTVTFSITPRHVKNYDLSGSNIWTFGAQSGIAEAGADGLLTVDGLVLNDGEGYTVLTIKKQ